MLMLHNVDSMSHQVKKNLGVTLHGGSAEFRVWAPFAKAVALTGTFTPDGPEPLTNEHDGYWSVVIKNVEPGHIYRYQIMTADGELLEKNDPRARAITSSDNGYSVIVDNEFDWGESKYVAPERSHQIIYELHIGTFNRPDAATTGTFETAIQKLDYLKNLGVNMIEVMPITSMCSSNGWGYNVAEIFSIEQVYGGRYGLLAFVRACHERGIGVIVDVVYNHFLSGTLWRFDGWYENDRGGIYFYNDDRGDTPWGSRPDYGRPEVRHFLLDSIVMWFQEFRVDGLRLDSTAYMRNTAGHNDDPAHDIGDAWTLMQDITHLAHKINPHATIIAEDTSVNSFITKASSDGGCGFDAQWGLDFPHAIRQMLGINTSYYADLQTELLSSYNGDVFQKVIFSDSHDTAANGSVRINDAAAPRNPTSLIARQKLLLADALMLTAPGIPMLLQGAEFLQDGAFNDWQALEWKHVEKHEGIVKAHQHLIKLRLNEYANTAGLLGQSTAIIHRDDFNHVIGYHRWDQGGIGDDVVVITNFSDQVLADYNLTLPRPGTWTVRFNSSWRGYSADFNEQAWDSTVSDDTGMVNLTLAPYGIYILSQ